MLHIVVLNCIQLFCKAELGLLRSFTQTLNASEYSRSVGSFVIHSCLHNVTYFMHWLCLHSGAAFSLYLENCSVMLTIVLLQDHRAFCAAHFTQRVESQHHSTESLKHDP